MTNGGKGKRIRCKSCHRVLNKIWFTALCTEEWSWNGKEYNECTAMHSLTNSPDSNVECPHCGNIIGTGRDFGFGEGYK
ncbi:hypothetical protein KSU1_B0208 [Candidatus Jettenia caeni]|uniref:Uncharacterized protein n=1 Tax=Candidatus Jettenia caeni TaxID=247490 RepID=I3IH70_9BACT|nr:MAG: hypothetical protein QY317_03610 [Candidatus Jettenia caeni]GAB61065.1 hypothetical protein KSU1_B0208 [Candidatus Jettenia caeni]